MQKITIDPVTRIEGHLKIEVMVDAGEVKEATSSGTLFRGLELILRGRDPRDASRIVQRACGVCPSSHATASVFALDRAFGIENEIPNNGRILRNLILGANFIQSHILHFYHLAALDYIDLARLADYGGDDLGLMSLKRFIAGGELVPFLPRYEGDYRLDDKTNQDMASHYLRALEMRRKAHEMLAVFGGKMPHNVAVVAGGVTERPTIDKITSFLWRLNEIREFIDNVYIPDVLRVAKSYPDYLEIGSSHNCFLSYGAFDLDMDQTDQTRRRRLFRQGFVDTDLHYEALNPEGITEEVKHSWYADSTTHRHPSQGETIPEMGKAAAYSWLKAPRYKGNAPEVGPLARMVVSWYGGDQKVRQLLSGLLSEMKVEFRDLFSVLGRHAARALDCKLVADAMADWVLQLTPGEPVCATYELPQEGEGMGLTGAPRGALGHWIRIKEGVIESYQLVVPTTWNASPKDDSEQPGPLEKALLGTKVKDTENPFEIVRIVRSFDPCLACAVHVVNPYGREFIRFRTL